MAATKIFFVINSLQRGGAERVLSTLGNSLSTRNYDVTIVCMNQSITGYPIADNVKVVTLVKRQAVQHLARRIWYGILTYVRLLRLLMIERPFCVISFMTSANLWTGLACGLLRIPYIVSERTTPELTIHQFGPFYKWLSFQIYKNSKAIVIPAKGIEQSMKSELKFKQLENYRIIRNPVYEFQPSVRKQVHTKNFILGIGRLSYEKGFDQLIDAFSKLQIHDIDLLIIGVGLERQKLLDQIQRLQLHGRVFLLGPKTDVEHYYRSASVFVCPSRNEGYPNALVEAMSNGCACVSMDCEFGPAEIIENGVNGILVPDGNVAQLATSIFDLLLDPEYRNALGRHASRIKETNALALISDQWEELIMSGQYKPQNFNS